MDVDVFACFLGQSQQQRKGKWTNIFNKDSV